MTDEKDVKLATGDKALLELAQTGRGGIKLTAEKLAEIAASLKAREEEITTYYPKLVEACPPEMRLAVAAWVFKHIVDHAKEGGTFRYLIYDRMGFGPEAYVPLYMAGGMTISNEFDLTDKEKGRTGVRPEFISGGRRP